MTDGTEHMVGIYLFVAAGLVAAAVVSVGLAVIAKHLFRSGAKGRRGLP
jgi:hypothetical protein